MRSLILTYTSSGGPAFLHAKGAIWNRSHPDFWQFALLGMLHMIWRRRAPEILMNNLIFRDSYVDRSRFTPRPITLGDWLRPARSRDAWGRQVAWRLDYRGRLAEIRAPTFVVAGRFDPQMPPNCSLELVSAIPEARLVMFEHSGHYPFVEESDGFWSSVQQFPAERTETDRNIRQVDKPSRQAIATLVDARAKRNARS